MFRFIWMLFNQARSGHAEVPYPVNRIERVPHVPHDVPHVPHVPHCNSSDSYRRTSLRLFTDDYEIEAKEDN